MRLLPQISNLVLEGGGIKGIAYLGALKELTQQGFPLQKLQRVAGTSIGAIVSLFIGLGYSIEEIEEIILEEDFQKFQDDSRGFVRDTYRFIQEFGFYRGDYFKRWIEKVIYTKTKKKKITFAEVNALKKHAGFKEMYFVATNLSTKQVEIFSHEHTPHFTIADAVRCSASVPFLYSVIRLKKSKKGRFISHRTGDIYLDGGILNNYPIKIFDHSKYIKSDILDGGKNGICYNPETLGIRVDEKWQIAHFVRNKVFNKKNINELLSYCISLIEIIVSGQQDEAHKESSDVLRTIYIDSLNFKTLEFSIDRRQKQFLIESGREAAIKYLERIGKLSSHSSIVSISKKNLNKPIANDSSRTLPLLTQLAAIATSITLFANSEYGDLIEEAIRVLSYLEKVLE